MRVEAEALTLDIPPAPEFVITARLFVAAAARHFGLDEEAVADLKLAVSEACTQAISAHGRAAVQDPVSIVLTPEPGMLDVEVRAGRAAFELPAPGEPDLALTPRSFGQALSNALIHSLFPDAELSGEGGLTVRFSLPRPEGLEE